MLKIAGRILNFSVWLGIVALVLVIFVLPFGTSTLIALGYYPVFSGQWWLDGLHQAQVWAMLVFFWVWVFFVGSCFASFLNVVAWRVPRGKSILGSSHCPQCNIKLGLRDNLPVLGWMRNEGRCNNCELPIPVRYLLAELILGATFLTLFVLQTVSGGMTIPFRTLYGIAGIENILFQPQADLLITLGYHLTLLSLIFTLAIAATEKFTAPISLVIFGIIAAAGFQCLAPAPGVLDFRFGNPAQDFIANRFIYLISNPQDFAISIGLGIVASGLCFMAIGMPVGDRTHGAFACLLLIGIWLGWQSVISITLISFLLSPVKSVNACGKLLFATLAHLCLWRLQTHCQWWPGPASGLQGLALGGVYLSVLAFVSRTTTINRDESDKEATIDLSGAIGDVE